MWLGTFQCVWGFVIIVIKYQHFDGFGFFYGRNDDREDEHTWKCPAWRWLSSLVRHNSLSIEACLGHFLVFDKYQHWDSQRVHCFSVLPSQIINKLISNRIWRVDLRNPSHADATIFSEYGYNKTLFCTPTCAQHTEFVWLLQKHEYYSSERSSLFVAPSRFVTKNV